MVKDLTQAVPLRSAFTMIELIFAIVIISISMLALPMVMQIDAKNQEDALFQEGILITTTKVSQALTFPWDPNSSPGGALMSLSNVLDTGSASAGVARVAGTDFRVGHFQETIRRRMTPVSAPRAALAIAGGTNSVANQHGNVEVLGGGQYTYKKQWSAATTVTYVSDFTDFTQTAIAYDFPTNAGAGGGTTNIKMIQVIATDVTPGSAGNSIELTSYASNIGEQEFYKRRY